MATSLPSFSQAFSTHSLSSIPTNNNALPPIQPRPNYRLDSHSDPDPNDDHKTSRKRTQRDDDNDDRDDLHPIKQEDGPHDSPPDQPMPLDDPDPPSAASPLKKRRVTVSGAPHPLNTDLRPPSDQSNSNSTPISPVVMGFTINRDNPAAIEQVRSMVSVMHKQKALIEQRRGSQAPPPSTNQPEERISGASSKAPIPPRTSRRSPNTQANPPPPPPPPRRAPPGSARPSSPTPMLTPSLPSGGQHSAQQSTQTLPPPPISFARRRAGQFGGKKKPADILISPREAQSPDQFQPSIQSAPPIPHAGQGAFQAARFSMALPRLPPVMGATDNVRRVASNVPPTPTRLSLLRPPATASTPKISVSGRSPPAPSVPIASTLVPPTPASLKHPGYSGDKSAFLAPFEVFYDALNDSKQLKTWLGEQLQKSNALVQSLTQQQEKLNDTIEAAVEKRVSGMRTEMMVLRRRVEDLEDALRNASASPEMVKGKQPLRNGTSLGPHDSYSFPPPLPSHPPIRRAPSPGWMQDRERDRDVRGNPHHHPDSGDRHPSPSYDSRRLATVSATRLDPPPTTTASSSSSHHPSSRPAVSSPPQLYRDRDHSSSQNLPPMRERDRDVPPPPPRSAMRGGGEKPGLTRTHSHGGGNSPNQGALPPPHTPSSASSIASQQQQAMSQQQQQQQSTSSVVGAAATSSSTNASVSTASSSASSLSSRRPPSPPSGGGGESS